MSRWLLLVAMLAVGACQLREAAGVTPEAAVAACTGPVTLALRVLAPEVTAVTLAAGDASRIERRRTRVGRQPIAVVVEGGGAARTAGDVRPVRYLCLLDPGGRVVFVDASTAGGEILAECPGAPAARTICLADRLRAAERELAAAEAAALRRVDPGRRASLEEPLATSIGAWRVYRDAECARRRADAADLAAACRIALTRARAAELAG